jgi:Tfp pilus assembly protein PilV
MKTQLRRHYAGSARGFSLLEVLVLVVVIAIVGVAAGQALVNVARTPVAADQNFQIETQLISKMEDIRAMSFDSVAVGSPNSTLSDIVTIAGTDYQRTVTVTLADANGDGLAEAGFKAITVTCGGQTVSTLISR